MQSIALAKIFFAADEKEGTEKGTQKVQKPCLKDKQLSQNGKIFPMVILPYGALNYMPRNYYATERKMKQTCPESIEPRKRIRWPKTIEACKRN